MIIVYLVYLHWSIHDRVFDIIYSSIIGLSSEVLICVSLDLYRNFKIVKSCIYMK